MKPKYCLAYGEVFPVLGVCSAFVSLNKFYYIVFFSVVVHLVCSEMIGLDLLSHHDRVIIRFGGKKTQMDAPNLAAFAENNKFRATIIHPPKFFSDKIYQAKPIATKFRLSNKEIFLSLCGRKILNLLSKRILRCSTSPGQPQAFVVKDRKRCMAVEYSMTVNLITSLVAYPFPNMEELLNNASENHFYRILT